MKYLIVLTIIFFSFAHAEVRLVGSKGCVVESLSSEDIKKIFLLKKKSIENQRVTPIDRSNRELYYQFITTYLNKSVRKMKTYWVRMLFTGKKIPPKKLSLRGLEDLKDETSCYLSYINKGEAKPKGWKNIVIQ